MFLCTVVNLIYFKFYKSLRAKFLMYKIGFTLVFKYEKSNMRHVTRDMRHVTRDM